jgi:hypothetical protein
LQLKETASTYGSSCEYMEQAVEDSYEEAFLQLGRAL